MVAGRMTRPRRSSVYNPPGDDFEFPVNHYWPSVLVARSPLLRECLAELLCTFTFLLIGVGCVIQRGTTDGLMDNFLALNICWGLSVAFSGTMGIGISGGHMNPSVSLAQWSLGRLPFVSAICYSLFQLIGAFAGTALAYGNYVEALNQFDGGSRRALGQNGTLCFLVTCPASYTSHWGGVLDQTVATGILTATMASVIDARNKVPQFLHPLFGGLVVIMIGTSYAVQAGYPINPARDLGARLFAWIIYGNEAFTAHDYWFWVPIVGPLIGGFAGAWVYNVLIDVHSRTGWEGRGRDESTRDVAKHKRDRRRGRREEREEKSVDCYVESTDATPRGLRRY